MKVMDILVEGNATIVCGKAALQAVFYNMLNNSYDAIIQEVNHRRSAGDEKGYRGVIKLSISQDNDITSVYFKDNGIGMNEEVKEEIFIPLFTTKSHEEKKDKRLTGGTGIGMFTIQKMLASQGGKLEIVESKEHEGSEFLMKIQKGGKDA